MARFFAITRAQTGTALEYDALTASAAVAASYTTNLTGTNNDIVWTADVAGFAGNGISIAYVDPGGVTATASVSVSGQAITVSLGRAASAINTTSTALQTLVNSDPTAGAMVTGANSGADTGAGLVTAMPATFLSGGDDADRTIPALATADFTSGPPPNAFAWPVTGGTVDRNIERIDRNAEVRYGRVPTPPLPFRANPTITVPVAAYLDVIRQVIPKVMGSNETTTTPAPGMTSGVTQHRYVIPTATAQWTAGENKLPWFYSHILREDLYDRMSGTYINRVTFNFPIDGEGTMEVELHGLYMRHYGTPSPAIAVAYQATLSDVLMLRDAKAFVNNSPSQVTDIQGISITFNNNVVPKWYAGRNRTQRRFYDPAGAAGNTAQGKKLWWPAEQRLTGQLDITYSLTFGSVTAAQEISIDYTQIQKFQFDILGNLITGSTPSQEELLRFTIPGGAATGGGAGDLVARDDITTTVEGTANDLIVDIWDGTTTALTTNW